MLARRFIQIEHTQNIGLQNRRERPVNGNAAQMHDGIHTLDHGVYCMGISQVSQHHFFARGSGANVYAV